MRLGLLLNSKNELPIPIIELVAKLTHEMDLKIYNVSNLIESVCFSKKIIFDSLVKTESLLTRTGIKCRPYNVELANELTIADMDMVLCWGTEYDNSSVSSDKIVCLYLNDKRLDQSDSGLIEVLNEESFQLNIRSHNGSRAVCIASMRCKVYHSLAKTKSNALNNICILLGKVIKGKVYQTEEIGKADRRKSKRGDSLQILLIMYKALRSRAAQKMTPTWYWDIHVGKSENIKELRQIGEITKKIDHDEDGFWADPFIQKYNGFNYIFFEEFKYKIGKGNISVLRQELDGSHSYLGVVMDFEHHLSYPFVFEVDGGIYMIPETGDKKSINLYKCTDFPLKWDFFRTILDGFDFVDTTVFFSQNIFWLFTSAKKNGVNQDSQLLLYYTDDIINGELIEHPDNPIVYGVDRSRMAGGIFHWQNLIIRPAQDCSEGYGGAIRFMAIEELTENAYSERQMDMLLPFSGYKGTHTFNKNEDILVADTHIPR